MTEARTQYRTRCGLSPVTNRDAARLNSRAVALLASQRGHPVCHCTFAHSSPNFTSFGIRPSNQSLSYADANCKPLWNLIPFSLNQVKDSSDHDQYSLRQTSRISSMNQCHCSNGRMDELAADKPSQRYLPHGNIHKPLHDIYRMAQPPSPGTSNAADKKKR